MRRSTEAAQVKLVQLFGASAIDSPGLTGVEESSQHYCTVDLQLGDETESQPVSRSLYVQNNNGINN